MSAHVDAWIAQLDTHENIEAHRTRPHLGLAEIQIKAFERVLAEYYVGDEVPAYLGNYFIPESFECRGCSHDEAHIYVKVWIEIEDRQLVLDERLKQRLAEAVDGVVGLHVSFGSFHGYQVEHDLRPWPAINSRRAQRSR